mmetsp:Transcript_17544/g.24378  ORF Transcript_17544/g.24378 Transcript_17544/m.24378 type:complete len:104 (+) Transcript_17544:486-797(+)
MNRCIELSECAVCSYISTDATAEDYDPLNFLTQTLTGEDAECPFDTYCKLLMKTLQRNNVRLMETGLTNNHGVLKVLKQQNNCNWNQNRKSLYIVATESADEE